MFENIKNFKKEHFYFNSRELTPDECEKIGIGRENYKSLEECAYQCAYDLSGDWMKDCPTWHDVQEAYKLGAADGIAYQKQQTYT
jgi:hypothetical protein